MRVSWAAWLNLVGVDTAHSARGRPATTHAVLIKPLDSLIMHQFTHLASGRRRDEARNDVRAALDGMVVLLNDAHELRHLRGPCLCADERCPLVQPALQHLQHKRCRFVAV